MLHYRTINNHTIAISRTILASPSRGVYDHGSRNKDNGWSNASWSQRAMMVAGVAGVLGVVVYYNRRYEVHVQRIPLDIRGVVKTAMHEEEVGDNIASGYHRVNQFGVVERAYRHALAMTLTEMKHRGIASPPDIDTTVTNAAVTMTNEQSSSSSIIRIYLCCRGF